MIRSLFVLGLALLAFAAPLRAEEGYDDNDELVQRRLCTFACETTTYYNYQLYSVRSNSYTLYEDQVPAYCGGYHQTSPGYYFTERVTYNSCW